MAASWATRFLLWGVACACITAYGAQVCLLSDVAVIWKVLAGILVIVGSLSTLIAFHISTLRCSQSHTLKTLLIQYVIFQGLHFYAPFFFSKMAKVWKQTRKEQEAFLLKLIARDADTEYGRRYLSGIGSVEEYRKKHPLTKYDHYEEYFKRLADGEKNVCAAARIDRFGVSSGTTGKGKLIPYIRSKSSIFSLYLDYKEVGMVRSSSVQKYCILYCKPPLMFTKSRLPIAPVVFIPTNKEENPNDGGVLSFLMRIVQNTPFSAFKISTDFEATYVHLLFALTDKNLSAFMAPFASQLYRAFAMLEDEQDMFLEDLTEGRVNPRLNIDEEIRHSLDAALKPNPARAKEIKEGMARGFVGIVGRIWPHMDCLLTLDISGYIDKLKARYAKGVKIFSPTYSCTEAIVGINLWNDGSPGRYVIFPNEILVEFIPEDCSGEENPDTLLMDEVEVGKRYEVVFTAPSGFYRYRVGDVVEVVDFHYNCPVIQVKYRTGELFNLRSEKIDKVVVENAVQEIMRECPGASLVEWTCAESPLMYEDTGAAEYDMFYLLFVELESTSDVQLSAEQKSLFDKSLRKQHEIYHNYRQAGTICEPRVFLVAPGSFQRLKEFIIATSTASYNQFKTPKKLRTKATLDLMMNNVI